MTGRLAETGPKSASYAGRYGTTMVTGHHGNVITARSVATEAHSLIPQLRYQSAKHLHSFPADGLKRDDAVTNKSFVCCAAFG